MKNSKKGFTLVELLVVIAILAILATVAVVGYTSFIEKANESADMQAITQMNTVLTANDILEDTDNILVVFNVLEAAGLSAKDYHPLAKDMYFFWDANLNKVLYVDKNMKVVAPAEHAGKVFDKTKDTWLSLTQKIEASKPAEFAVSNKATTVKVASGAELLYVINEIKAGNVTTATITIPEAGIDMMGASFGIGELKSTVTIKGEGTAPAVIKNVTAVDTTFYGDGVTEGNDGQYSVGLFGNVWSNLTIENVTFENVHVKNTHASGVAILVGIKSGGTLKLTDVTIKNSSVIGHRNVGAIIGNTTGKLTITGEKGLVLENVDVLTIGGRSGLLIGYTNSPSICLNGLDTAKISIDKDCSYEIYNCEQNTGKSPEGKDLGLQSNGAIWSWCYDGTGKEDYNTDKYFVEGALITINKSGVQVAGNDYFKDGLWK